MSRFGRIPEREWMYGYRSDAMPDGRVVEVIRQQSGAWMAWVGPLHGSGAIITQQVAYRDAMRTARQYMGEQS